MRRPLCLLLCLVLLSGCWSRREITETAFAGAMAVDWDEEEQQYVLTLNILLPVAGGPGQGATGGTKADPAGKPVWTIQARAKALDEAVGRLERLSPRRLYLAHVRSILIGEAMARRGIGPVLDFLVRLVEIRPTLWVGVVRGKAAELQTARPTMEGYPANGPMGYHDLIERRSAGPAFRLAAVIATLSEEGIDLVLPSMRLAGPEGDPTTLTVGGPPAREVEVGGAGLFRGDRLVDWLEPDEARGLLWGLGRAGLGPVVTPCPGGGGSAVYRLRRNHTRARVDRTGRSARATLEVRLVADIDEVECLGGPRTPERIRTFEKALEGEVRREVESVLKLVRKHRIDPLGLGQRLFRRDAAAYRALERRWPQILAEMPVKVEVEVSVPRMGQIYGNVRNLFHSNEGAPSD